MASSNINENVGKLSNETVLYIEWKIQDFFSLPMEVDYCFRSSSFQFKGAKWYLRLYPNGEAEEDSAGYISIYIVKENSTSLTDHVNFQIGISKNDGNVYESWYGDDEFHNDGQSFGVYNLAERSAVCNKRSELAPNGVLTIFCYLNVKSRGASNVSTQTSLPEDNDEYNEENEEFLTDDKSTGTHKLAKNLKDLLLNEEECDVTLKVRNRELKAHKAILIARNPVFNTMFRNEMTEKESGEIHIKDCDPDAFYLFLKYLYTGKIEGLSTSNVFNLHEIANKYLAKEVKNKCTEYMISSLSVETVCDVIVFSLLHEEDDMLEKTTDFFTKHYKEIIFTVKWQQFLKKYTTAANELLIKSSKYYNPPE